MYYVGLVYLTSAVVMNSCGQIFENNPLRKVREVEQELFLMLVSSIVALHGKHSHARKLLSFKERLSENVERFFHLCVSEGIPQVMKYLTCKG